MNRYRVTLSFDGYEHRYEVIAISEEVARLKARAAFRRERRAGVDVLFRDTEELERDVSVPPLGSQTQKL